MNGGSHAGPFTGDASNPTVAEVGNLLVSFLRAAFEPNDAATAAVEAAAQTDSLTLVAAA